MTVDVLVRPSVMVAVAGLEMDDRFRLCVEAVECALSMVVVVLLQSHVHFERRQDEEI